MLSYNINIQDAARLCSTKNNIDTNPIQQCMATSVRKYFYKENVIFIIKTLIFIPIKIVSTII
jgi:hypothetical protein